MSSRRQRRSTTRPRSRVSAGAAGTGRTRLRPDAVATRVASASVGLGRIADAARPTGPSRRFARPRRGSLAPSGSGHRLRACTKAWSRTSSTSSGGCPASVPRAPSGSRSTCSPADPADVRRLVARADRGQGQGPVLPRSAATSPRRSECRICRDTAARPVGDLRGRGAQGRRRDRADPRVPRPLPRARRRDQPDRGHRARRPAGPGADGPAGRRQR